MIRNIIFDLGGVLLNIDFKLTIKCFRTIGVNNIEQLFSKFSQHIVFDQLDRGEISESEFHEELREITGKNLSTIKINHAWNAMLLDFPQERIELLKKVRANYRVFLLSNTNSIHYPTYMQYMERSYGVKTLGDIFEKEYLSFEIGKRKPDTEAFLHVLNDQNINPAETLFIDDTPFHVEGAKKTGIQGYWLDLSKENITGLFDKKGLFKNSRT